MSDFFEKLEKYGLKKEEVMMRFVDDEEFYKDCYIQVLNDEAFGKLKEYIDSGNNQEAFDCAHGLKGILANIGMKTLFDATSDLVEVLRGTRTGNVNELYEELIRLRDECILLAE